MSGKPITILVGLILLSSILLIANLPATSSESINGNIEVSDDPTGTSVQISPDIAVDQNGRIHVVWFDTRSGTPDVQYSNSANQGISFNTSKKLGDADNPGVTLKSGPAIAVDNNNKIHVAWYHYTGGNEFEVYTANSTDGGATFKPNYNVSDNRSAHQIAADIATYGANNVYVVWSDNRNGNWDIYFARSTDGGSTYGPNLKINGDAGPASQNYPKMAVDSSGTIHVVWEDNRSGDYDIYHARSTNGGASFSTNIVAAGGAGSNQTEPAITIGNTNIIYVTYSNNSNDESDIYFIRSANSGSTWTAGVKVNDNVAQTTQSRSAVAVNSTGKIYVAFQDNRTHVNDSGHDIYISNSTNGGTSFGADDVANNDTGSNDHLAPKLAVGPDDSVYILWADDRVGFYDIYLARIKGPGISNSPPAVTSIAADPKIVTPNGESNITVSAGDLDSDPLTYIYDITGGAIIGSGQAVKWKAPAAEGLYNISVWVNDGKVNSNTMMTNVTVRAANTAPVINTVTADPAVVGPGGSSNISVDATDAESDPLTYEYIVTGGNIQGTGADVKWLAPEINGIYNITARVTDGLLYSENFTVNVTVQNQSIGENSPPVVNGITAEPAEVTVGGTSYINVSASDANSDPLSYHYNVTGGGITGTGANVTWTAPATPGTYRITVRVNDSKADSNEMGVNVTVIGAGGNTAPVVVSISAEPSILDARKTSNITVVAVDADGDLLTYLYNTTGGAVSGTGPNVTWTAPDSSGVFMVEVKVFDGTVYSNTRGVNITVTGGSNTAPVVEKVEANRTAVKVNGTVAITVTASDADNDSLTYIYNTTGGAISGQGAEVIWTAPADEGTYTITVTVNDGMVNSLPGGIDIAVTLAPPLNGSFVDLEITDGDITLSDNTPEEDQNITVTVVVHNRGTRAAYNVTVHLYSNTTLIMMKYIDVIPAGGSGSAVFDHHSSAGEFRLEAVADLDNRIPESDETNNIGNKDIKVTPKKDGGDPGPGPGGDNDDESEAPLKWFGIGMMVFTVIFLAVALWLFLKLKKKQAEKAAAEQAAAAEPVSTTEEEAEGAGEEGPAEAEAEETEKDRDDEAEE